MNKDPQHWFEAGKKDREMGNEQPGLTREDFHREIEDVLVAVECADAYQAGFHGAQGWKQLKAFPIA